MRFLKNPIKRVVGLPLIAVLVAGVFLQSHSPQSMATGSNLDDSNRSFNQIITVGDGTGKVKEFGAIQDKVTLGTLASRTQQRPYSAIVDKGGGTQEVSGVDSLSEEVYTFLTDKDYINTSDSGQRNEGFEGSVGIDPRVVSADDGSRQVVTVESVYSHQSCSAKSSNTAGYGDTDERYCSLFGPEIWSNAFTASAGEALSFDYKANSTDQYEPYGFLVKVSDMGSGNYSFGGADDNDPSAESVTDTHQIVLYTRGQNTTNLGGWLTASGDVEETGSYRFRFVNGTFDGTGGAALGAAFQVDAASIDVALSQTITFANPGDQVGISGSLDISATSSAGLDITYATTTPSVCAFSSDGSTTSETDSSGATVTLFKRSAGDCNLTANASGDGTYAAAALKTASFEVLTAATAPVNNVRPRISGTAAAGSTLAVSEGEADWSNGGSAITATTYQWISILSGVTSNIPGATASSLCVPASLVGATLKVEVTKTNGVGSVSEESASTVAVAAGTACPSQVPGGGPAGGNGNDEEPTPTAAPPAETGPVVVLPRRAAPPPQTNLPVTRQGPVFRNGVAPSQVRAPEVRIGGVATSVQSSVTNPSTLSVRAGSLSLGVQVQQDQGGVSQAADGTTEIGVSKGGRTTLSGSGLRPGSTVQVFLPLQGSNAKELTRIPVGLDGSFSGDAAFATAPEDAPLPIGRQVMQLVSVDEDGNEVVVDMTVNVAQSAPTPEFNRVDGVIPTMTPGSSVATNAGVPEEVTVTAVEEQKLAVVEGDGWSMAVAVGAEGGGVDGSDGGASITLVRDESAQISGEGFMPGTRADVWLFSDPTLLGTVTIDDEGRFDGDVNVDGRVVSAGEHTLQLQGVGVDGYVRAANMGVVVDDSSVVGTQETAAASLMFIWWVLAAVIALILALVVWLTIKRRQARI